MTVDVHDELRRSGGLLAAAARWDATYRTRGVDGVSWFQTEPAVSLQLIEAAGVAHDAAIIDVGGGASVLVDHLVGRGYNDVSVLDVSAVALGEAQARLGAGAPVTWLHEDLLSFKPSRRYDLWHDRGVLHFLVAQSDRDKYRQLLMSSLAPGGHVVIGTFAEDGPQECSGLPVARYSGQALAEILGDSFLPTETLRESHKTPSGATQPFTWVTARLAG